jgi:malonyl-CoA O-methyltransferase
MHDLGDMLLAAGFADPVMEMEKIAFTYANPRGLLRDQRRLGRARRDCSGRWASARDGASFAPGNHRGAMGVCLPTFEIVYGHAWKAEPKASADGRAIIRFHK